MSPHQVGPLLRQAGYTYKRVRRCLRAQRNQPAFARSQRRLAHLRQLARRGRLQLWYTDECRVSRQAPVSYAWQKRGGRAAPVPAVRGRGGYSLLGFWQPFAAQQAFVSFSSATAFSAALWCACLEQWRQQLTQPAVLVLDNASIHRALLVQARQQQWAQQGVTLYYLPPYSPELNLIELLWHRLKYVWLAPADYASDATLYERLIQICRLIGPKYQITFQ